MKSLDQAEIQYLLRERECIAEYCGHLSPEDARKLALREYGAKQLELGEAEE